MKNEKEKNKRIYMTDDGILGQERKKGKRRGKEVKSEGRGQKSR